jgi:hypothetical protein
MRRGVALTLALSLACLAGAEPGDPAGASVGGPERDGVRINCELPPGLHQKNTGGSDGAGLCVYASARHAGRWQNDPAFAGLFDWMRKYPGGSYPAKFKKTLEAFCREKGLALPPYVQVEGSDLEILKLASKTGRMPGVTYSFSPTRRYGGQRIAHMVSLVHADSGHFVILDNNYIGADAYEWLTPEEFKRTYTGGRSGWAIILLVPGAPPMLKE